MVLNGPSAAGGGGRSGTKSKESVCCVWTLDLVQLTANVIT